MNVRPAGDGHRVVTDCAGGCGADVVCLPAYIGRARCVGCGRALHGATATGKVPPDRPAVSMPGRLDPERLSRTAETTAAPAVRKGLVEEWLLTDVRLPVGPRGFIEDLARAGITGARVCHTVALRPDGQLSETVGVHWGGGRAFWTKHVAATGKQAGKVSWTGEVYAPMRMTVTQAILAIRQRMGT